MSNIILYTLLGVSAAILLMVSLPHVIRLLKWVFTKSRYNKLGSSSQIRLIHQLYEASKELSSTKTGAIITID